VIGAFAVTEVPVGSVTVAVTDRLLTIAVGVPLIAPVDVLRLKPAGRELVENVYGGTPPLAVSALLYGVPTVPFTPLNCSVKLAPMFIVRLAVTDVLVESVTVAVTDRLFTAAVGVPLMTPVVAFTLNPAGRVVVENVYGGMPPVAVNDLLNGAPTSPFSPSGNCNFNVAAMLIVLFAVVDAPVESVRVALTERLFTAAVGVPLIAPVAAFTLRPAGNEVVENVYGGMPPVAVKELVYGVPTKPFTPGKLSFKTPGTETLIFAVAVADVPFESITVAVTD
jgi:hypothetical protein